MALAKTMQMAQVISDKRSLTERKEMVFVGIHTRGLLTRSDLYICYLVK